ncbi:carboxypeptidase B-like processing protease [Scheffersomyces amazonensis]|uniref:carboxypeptidase B-like processing protease n=1 Tax=Scheffersomyces amazonensis TaxID=1078765 RepID=UPI00315DC9B7
MYSILYNFILLISVVIQTSFALPPKLGATNDLQKQYLITDLPGLHKNIPTEEVPLMFSGQLQLYPDKETHYFFWKFSDSNKIPENNKRTIFWLNGGPGCSSMDGALMEAGPFRINKDKQVTYNNGSWHKAADIIFVDQPGGTGFSYTDKYDHELYEVTDHFLKFLEKYFEIFPEELSNEIYFAGESYAGQYIPYIADGILKYNKLNTTETPYNLKGLLIGNGWISPNEQSLSYLPFAVQAGIINSNNPRWQQILVQQERCQKIVNQIDSYQDDAIHADEISSTDCERILTYVLQYTRDNNAPEYEQCYNMYDYTLKDSYPSCGMNWPPDLVTVTPFLREEEVMNDLNLIEHKQWQECNGRVGSSLSAKNSIPSVHLLPGILEEIPVILFNGNLDIICNYFGTENFIKKLTWNGQKGFSEDLDAMNWLYGNETAGYIKSERNLTFVNVFNASHMVPFDKPEISRALIDLITGNYDESIKETDGTKSLITYPLGVRQAKIAAVEDSSSTGPASQTTATGSDTDAASDSDSDSEEETSEPASSSSSSRITRLIQLLVIIVLIWGLYVLYSSYKSRPSSIIKTGPTSGKKKNVQWADQLRRFQEDDQDAQNQQQQGFFVKTFNRLTGSVTDGRGNYAPTSAKVYEDIELGEGIALNDNDHTMDDFIIDSEEEEVGQVENGENIEVPDVEPPKISDNEVRQSSDSSS